MFEYIDYVGTAVVCLLSTNIQRQNNRAKCIASVTQAHLMFPNALSKNDSQRRVQAFDEPSAPDYAGEQKSHSQCCYSNAP